MLVFQSDSNPTSLQISEHLAVELIQGHQLYIENWRYFLDQSYDQTGLRGERTDVCPVSACPDGLRVLLRNNCDPSPLMSRLRACPERLTSSSSDDIIWDPQHSSGIIRPLGPPWQYHHSFRHRLVMVDSILCIAWLRGLLHKIKPSNSTELLMAREILRSNQI